MSMRYRYLHDEIKRKKNIMKGLYGKITYFSKVPADGLFIEANKKLYPSAWLFCKMYETNEDAEILLNHNPPWYPPTTLFVPFPPKHPVRIMTPTHPMCKFLFILHASALRPPKEIEKEVNDWLNNPHPCL